MGLRILVTGGSGFIGAHLVERLVRDGHRVEVLTRTPVPPLRLQLLGVADRVGLVKGDLTDPHSLAPAVREAAPDVVYHLAAYGVRASDQDLERSIQVNIAGATSLMAACAAVPLRRFVWVGSSFEYGSKQGPIAETEPLLPASLYGSSKLAGWLMGRALAQTYGIPLVTVRAFTAYGPMEHPAKLVPYVITQGLRGEPVTLTASQEVRDYFYVDDLVEGLVQAGSVEGVDGMTFNLGAGAGRQVVEIASAILARLGREDLLQVGAPVEARRALALSVANTEQAARYLKWHPRVPLEEGLGRTIAWYRDHRDKWGLLP